MVTIEQGGNQFEATGGATQTQNPQAIPQSNLQPNQSQEGLQSAVQSPSLFSNPQSSAIIVVPNAGAVSTESLLASEADHHTKSSSGNMSLAIVLILAVFAIVAGSYFIMQKLSED